MCKDLLMIFFAVIGLISCSKDEDRQLVDNSLYFPSLSSDEWLTSNIDSLGWNTSALADLYSYLEDNDTRAFIILKDGKIVVEQYWGQNILNTASFSMSSQWYWASAGKSLTAFLVGVAQQDNLINIEDPTSEYLGNGWTSLSKEKEDLITIRHQLTMTTGLDYTTGDLDCTDPECFQYKADAGTQWYYHNAPYTLLEQVVSTASGMDYNTFTQEKIEAASGMSGTWIKSGYLNLYWSTARDMARFGLLVLNKGKWADTEILRDKDYFDAMVNSSQDLNPSYGYLWWLNGKSSVIIPGMAGSLNTMLAPNAPDDLCAAAGKNGQFLDVIPSENMVVVRMGEAPDGSLVPVQFHNEMWKKISDLIILR